MVPFKLRLQQKNRGDKLEKERHTHDMSQKYEAKKWKIKTFFFETSVGFLSPLLSIGTPAWKWRKGLMGNRILISREMFPQPSDGIKQ